jgi:hypothetical protein
LNHLRAQVKVQFKLAKGRRYGFTGLRPNIFRSTLIRHISVILEARVKRSVPEDYYKLPAPNKLGAVLQAHVTFEDKEIGRGIPRECSVGPCQGVEADFVHVSQVAKNNN